MSSRWIALSLCLLAAPFTSAAQTAGTAAVNDFDDVDMDFGPPTPMVDCTEEQEAASIAGEIVVCRRRADDSEFRYSTADEAAKRYATETMHRDNPQAPDFIRDCAEQGWPFGCIKLGRAPPTVHFVDFASLPEAVGLNDLVEPE